MTNVDRKRNTATRREEARNYAKLPNIAKEHAKAAAVPERVDIVHRTPPARCA